MTSIDFLALQRASRGHGVCASERKDKRGDKRQDKREDKREDQRKDKRLCTVGRAVQ